MELFDRLVTSAVLSTRLDACGDEVVATSTSAWIDVVFDHQTVLR